ncbi:histidine kinase [Roseivivax halodurans JCM 10272]|uniref:Histidine kinase n=1 Tax=Roseivivax halodurans JCM 10272 TaxID=1449350 RepID=X7EN23_9RHOB|nr:PAS domain-containing protein [Roseivivax halodurans]ETX16591.1 histidine kinase [Roseivivax halodurans JCM 10272]
MTETTDLPASLRDYLYRTSVPLAVSDIAGDVPLVLVNTAFCDLTGYSEDEVVGQNCRFLQSEGTAEEDRTALRDFVRGRGADNSRFPILNYKKDGSEFHNFVFMTRLRDRSGEVRFVLASQFDMTTAVQRTKIETNDETLKRTLSDVEQIGREFGLAMIGSAQMISDSVATMARLTLDDDRP